MPKENTIKLKETIRSISDWPIKGVIFRDLTTLMQNPEAFRESCDILYERYKDKNIDKIVGIDARGFVFGAVLAYKLGIGFIPVRKKGKLPAPVMEQEYELEYGTDIIEIHKDSLKNGTKVLLVDDLLATGGTALAAAALIEKLGGIISEMCFIVNLPDVGGSGKLIEKGYKFYALTEFEGE